MDHGMQTGPICAGRVWLFRNCLRQISSGARNSIFGAAKDAFDLPKETKMQKISDRPGLLGYIGGLPTLPLYESIAIDTTTLEGVDHFTNIMWPAGNNTFRESVHSFSKLVEEFHEIVTRIVFENCGVEKLFNYKAPQTNESVVGLVAHTDGAFVSILRRHEVKGLQIKTKDDQSIDVNPQSSSFVVLAGDGLQVWSNDRVRSCEHRVMVKEDKTRYSIGLFTIINGVMDVPEELVDDEHPLRYKPFENAAYTRFRATEGGKYASPIKAFCGI